MQLQPHDTRNRHIKTSAYSRCRISLAAAAALATIVVATSIQPCPTAAAAEPVPTSKPALFDHSNLVAWCIVPFDAKQRGPEERAEMLNRLGFTKFAYDYRAEHIPTFEAEVKALTRHHIQLVAWWFPEQLNDEARGILAILQRHNLKIDLWVMGSGGSTNTAEEHAARVKAEAARIRPIAEEAAKIGCRVGLYNHGGWFGEPENQLAIIEALNLPNVGMVYNQHHGHGHIERFTELLAKMKPKLLALNLNGMVRDGEAKGKKIVPLGGGELDLELLRVIADSGSPLRRASLRSTCIARSRSPRLNHCASPSRPSISMARQDSSTTPQPRTVSLSPASA